MAINFKGFEELASDERISELKKLVISLEDSITEAQADLKTAKDLIEAAESEEKILEEKIEASAKKTNPGETPVKNKKEPLEEMIINQPLKIEEARRPIS